jgi:hypothetical protein
MTQKYSDGRGFGSGRFFAENYYSADYFRGVRTFVRCAHLVKNAFAAGMFLLSAMAVLDQHKVAS